VSEPADLLAITDLTFARGNRHVLEAVNWHVRSGDFAFVVGENGAGKTTLLKCLCQALTPKSGTIMLAGKPLSSRAPQEQARMISYLPQADHRVVPYQVRDYVAMGRYPYLNPWAGLTTADNEAIESAMLRVGVDHLAERIMTTLSGGERRKVSLAAALAQGAQTLLLDEPATFLDPKHQVDLQRILRQLNDDGITIIMVTHDLNTMAALGNNVLALRQGRVVYSGSKTEFLKPSPLKDTFSVEFDLQVDESGNCRIYPREPA
jgi:iron complex transport system ATP-binding protein